MKHETKLWIRSIVHRCALAARKRALMALRAIVWHVDEWIQRQEVALREELARWKQNSPKGHAECAGVKARSEERAPSISHRETFEEWELRKSGVRPVTKRIHKRRYRPSATEFDRSVIDRRKDWLQ
jgi:hypothetical protein